MMEVIKEFVRLKLEEIGIVIICLFPAIGILAVIVGFIAGMMWLIENYKYIMLWAWGIVLYVAVVLWWCEIIDWIKENWETAKRNVAEKKGK